ncbi:MAG: hypothetical protein S4CHLAM7_12670 [Chlamydiae bacterium]|nr:hypothetical protein [Chlamydiota bacterium]
MALFSQNFEFSSVLTSTKGLFVYADNSPLDLFDPTNSSTSNSIASLQTNLKHFPNDWMNQLDVYRENNNLVDDSTTKSRTRKLAYMYLINPQENKELNNKEKWAHPLRNYLNNGEIEPDSCLKLLKVQCTFNEANSLLKLLVATGANVNNEDNSGYTPLHWSAHNGDVDATKALIKAQADVDIQYKTTGETPLHMAIREERRDVPAILINALKDPNIQDNSGYTPLHWSATLGHPDEVKALITARADVNISNNQGKTPLHCVAKTGSSKKHTDAIELLIAAQASLNSKNKREQSPLDVAIEHCHFNLLKILAQPPSNNGE